MSKQGLRQGLEVSCGGTGTRLDTLIEVAVLAEQSGWEAVFFEDYLVHYDGDDPPTYDPWIMLAAIAVRTTRIRLGTTVTALPRRHPGKLAREATTLDHLSGGRVTLAVGAGDPADRGVSAIRDPADPGSPRAGRLDDGLEVLLALLSGERVEHEGPYFRVEGVQFRPPPVQQPRLPVWVGGSLQAGAVLRRAARADGIVPYKLTDTDRWSDFTPAEIQQLITDVESHRARSPDGPEAGRPFDIALGGRRRRKDEVAEQRYLKDVESAGATWWLEFVPAGPVEVMLDAVRRGPLSF